MRYLLDTCTFIWLCAEPGKLSRLARALIDDEQNAIVVSDVSALEITLKWSAGKLALPSSPRQWFEAQIRTWAVEQLAVTRADMYRASELPHHHRDPFDRLLIAVALGSDTTLLTPDPAIHAYAVSWKW